MQAVHETDDGALWLGLGRNAGLVRHRPLRRAPNAPTIAVQTDRDDSDLAALPRLLTGQRVTFTFNVVDFRTVPAQRQFRWQLFQGTRDAKALEAGGQSPSTGTQLEKSFDKPGAWKLAVQFVDRDLNCSAPRMAVLDVAPPWHANLAIMVPAGASLKKRRCSASSPKRTRLVQWKMLIPGRPCFFAVADDHPITQEQLKGAAEYRRDNLRESRRGHNRLDKFR